MTKRAKTIKVNGTIVSDSNAFIYRWFGIPVTSPSMIASALDEANGEPVEVLINSGGGSVFAGSEIYTLIKDYPGETVGKVTGLAASAASVIGMGVDKLLISPTGQIMIHNASVGTDGDRNFHTQQADMLLSVDEAITNAYSIKTGKSKEELLSLMDKTTWMNAQKAVELGFADEVMFMDAGADVSNSSVPGVELPQSVIDKVRNEILKHTSADDLAVMIDPQAYVKPTPENPLNNPKKGVKAMNLEELKNQHPDLYAQVMNMGVQQERQRINELNALADAPGAAEIVAKAINDGSTAAEAAVAIVKASKERVSEAGKSRKEDAEKDGPNAVAAAEQLDKPNPDSVAKEEADGVLAYINEMRGGRK